MLDVNPAAAAAAAKSLQLCPTLCDPRDSSPPGSPVPGILQAQGPGVCKLPKPPASRALCQAKRAPRAAFPSGCLAPNPARIKCCFQSRKELGVSSVLCKIRGCGGDAWAKLESLGQSSGPSRPEQAEHGTRLRAGLQRGGGRSRRRRRAENRGAETERGGGAGGRRRPNRRSILLFCISFPWGWS